MKNFLTSFTQILMVMTLIAVGLVVTLIAGYLLYKSLGIFADILSLIAGLYLLLRILIRIS